MNPIYTDAQLSKAARALCERSAGICGVNADDDWKFYSENYIADARCVLDAAALTERQAGISGDVPIKWTSLGGIQIDSYATGRKLATAHVIGDRLCLNVTDGDCEWRAEVNPPWHKPSIQLPQPPTKESVGRGEESAENRKPHLSDDWVQGDSFVSNDHAEQPIDPLPCLGCDSLRCNDCFHIHARDAGYVLPTKESVRWVSDAPLKCTYEMANAALCAADSDDAIEAMMNAINAALSYHAGQSAFANRGGMGNETRKQIFRREAQ